MDDSGTGVSGTGLSLVARSVILVLRDRGVMPFSGVWGTPTPPFDSEVVIVRPSLLLFDGGN